MSSDHTPQRIVFLEPSAAVIIATIAAMMKSERGLQVISEMTPALL